MNNSASQPTHMTDAKGNLIAVENIKPSDLVKDDFVKRATEQAKKMQAKLQQFKQDMIAEFDAFIELLAQEHAVEMGGKKGNVTLRSFDQQLKVSVQVQERIELDEKLLLAKQLIDGCLAKWTQNGNENIKAIVAQTFQTDREGRVSPGRILSLRKIDIADESGEWHKAMELIAESVTVVDSSRFIRFYERDDNGAEKAISLDISKL